MIMNFNFLKNFLTIFNFIFLYGTWNINQLYINSELKFDSKNYELSKTIFINNKLRQDSNFNKYFSDKKNENTIDTNAFKQADKISKSISYRFDTNGEYFFSSLFYSIPGTYTYLQNKNLIILNDHNNGNLQDTFYIYITPSLISLTSISNSLKSEIRLERSNKQ